MPAVALSPQEAVAELIEALGAKLEELDPLVRQSSEALWKRLGEGETEVVRERRKLDYAHSLADIHMANCEAGAQTCVACAVSRSIIFCWMAMEDEHLFVFAHEVADLIQDYLVLQRKLASALERFQKIEDPIVKARGKRLFPGELRRRAVGVRVRLALELPIRLLRDVPGILLDEDAYPGMRPAADRKTGVRSQAVVDFITGLLKRETGLGDKRTGDLVDMTKADITRRRRKEKAGAMQKPKGVRVQSGHGTAKGADRSRARRGTGLADAPLGKGGVPAVPAFPGQPRSAPRSRD
jgi:hypothetical protein